MRGPASIILLVTFVTVAGCINTESPPPTIEVGDLRLDLILDGFDQPLLVTHAGDGSGRLFIVERPGMIHVVTTDGNRSVYADLRDRVLSTASEQGLLGLAFLPGDSSVAFISYTTSGGAQGTSVLSRFEAGNTSLDTDSEEVLLTHAQPFSNHNGGHLAFGPDGMLYFGLGDGGAGNDPQMQGQNPMTLLGTLLRLEVGPTGPYRIPTDNPFAGDPTGADEVWSYGLRNPWRFSFDRETGDLWIADVGQNAWEEVNFQSAASPGGENYGWNLFEGSYLTGTGQRASDLAGGLPVANFTFPVAEYANAQGHCSVTGGHVYRGTLAPELAGAYLYADFCSGRLWQLPGPEGEAAVLMETGMNISSFGEDEAGELYMVDFRGGVYRFTQQAGS